MRTTWGPWTLAAMGWLLFAGVAEAQAGQALDSSAGAREEPAPYVAGDADGRVTLDVVSPQRLSLEVLEADAGCAATPCTLALEPGVHRFAISLPGTDPQRTEPFELGRSGTLYARYVDNHRLRISGWITFATIEATAVAAGITGGVLIAQGSVASVVGGLLLAAGVGGLQLILGAVIGLPMALAGDGVVARFD